MESRRQFLIECAGVGAGAFSFGAGVSAQGGAAKTGRIDVHHHFTSPAWFAALRAADLVPGGRREWTPAKSIEGMDRSGTATALISTGQAGGAFTPNQLAKRGVTPAQADAEIRRLARESNEYGARMAADYPGRFGLMASLPFPNVDASLREIEFAFDTLKADGAFLATSYGGKYIGEPMFAPVLEELNRRKAVVYTHPTDAACCEDIIATLPPNTIEYGTDTTRMIMSLVVSGAAAKYPDMRWIFSHAGGTMPFLVGRILGDRNNLPAVLDGPAKPGTRLYDLRRFYYDTAASANPVAMTALKKVVGVSQIVFGTDYPYASLSEIATQLQHCGAFNAQELGAIDRGNALRILPKYRT
jgi:predicted TIM-barrel fold metal-dependent hydrolase